MTARDAAVRASTDGWFSSSIGSTTSSPASGCGRRTRKYYSSCVLSLSRARDVADDGIDSNRFEIDLERMRGWMMMRARVMNDD